MMSISLYNLTTETLTTCRCCLSKTGSFAGKFGQLVCIRVCVCHLFDHEVLVNRDHKIISTAIDNVPMTKLFTSWLLPSF